MYYHKTVSRDANLSSLARGRGFFRRGVEVECFIDDLKAYTLTGQPFLQPASTKEGRVAKVYKHQKLNLPKTYVTKRGQMVLFTAPEDMITGQSCTIHEKELTNKQAAHTLRTTDNLTQSVLNYGQSTQSGHYQTNTNGNMLQGSGQAFQESGQALQESGQAFCESGQAFQESGQTFHESGQAFHESGQAFHQSGQALQGSGQAFHESGQALQGSGRVLQGAWQDERMVKAGHFTDVYVRDLRKSVAARVSAEDCTVEDMEGEESGKEVKEDGSLVDMETQLIPECDSGLGQSIGPSPSGQLSAHSHRSESSTVISIPHGGISTDEARSPLTELPAEGDQVPPEDSGGLAALRQELGLYKVKGDSEAAKKPSKSSKKRHRNKPTTDSTTNQPATGNTTSKTKSKKKLNKSTTLAANSSSSIKTDASKSTHTCVPNKSGGGKGKKRRGGRKQHPDVVIRGDDADAMAGENSGKENEKLLRGVLDVTALQLAMEEGEDSASQRIREEAEQRRREEQEAELAKKRAGLIRRQSLADERKLEIERKRAEKRELERQRRLEEEERQRLKEELALAQMAKGVAEERVSEEEDMIEADTPTPSTPPTPEITASHQELLDALERSRLRENRLFLSFQGEQEDEKMAAEMRAVEEAVERARRVAEEEERRREEEERRRREIEEARVREEEARRREEERVQAELAKRSQAIKMKAQHLRQECHRSTESEKNSRRYQDNVSERSTMFSYFNYLPPPPPAKKSGKKGNAKRGKRPQKLQS